MPFNPYFIPVFLAGLICGGLAIFSWRQRPRPGSVEFALLLLAISLHCLGYSMELLNHDLGPILFWLRLEYIGIATEPSLWIVLVLRYTNRSHWLTPRNFGLLAIIPLLTLLFHYTNDLHHLYYAEVFVDYSGQYPLLAILRGPWYYVHSAYLFCAFAGGAIWLALQARRAVPLYRAQNLVMVLGACPPLVSYVLYMLNIQPVEHLDTTPVAFAVTGIITAWGLFRYRLLLVRPVARDVLFDYLKSGVILLDGEGCLTDINPSAVIFLGLHPPLPIGKRLPEVIQPMHPAFELDEKAVESLFEWHRDPYDLEVRISPLKIGGKQRAGYVILLTDITQLKLVQQIERQLLEQQGAMAVMEERERLASDLHDGVGQVLGYVSIQAQAAREMLDKNQITFARTALENLAEVAKDAHADIRTFILGVRGGESSGESFIETLKKYIEQFSRHYDIVVQLQLPDPAAPCSISGEAQAQLLSIIQEALNNIRKHARASLVEITIEYRSKDIRLTVHDNGRGFDLSKQAELAQDDVHHFGLHIMAERARVAGGWLQISTAPDQGCTVEVELPCQEDPLDEKLLSSLRVMIVDDQPLFRNGLRFLLQSREIQVVGEAADGEQAIRMAAELQPDMIMMDLHMPVMDGLQAAQAIKKQWPAMRILILTVDRAEGVLVESVRAGADGYLPKDMEAGRLFEVIESLMRGEPAFANEMAARTLVNLARQQGDENLAERFPILTQRQREILTMLAADMTNREIGQHLFLSEAAIKYHVGQIFEALEVKSRQEAILKVRQKLG